MSFTEYFHLLLTGGEPTDDQRFFLDLLLGAIAEHGMMPTNVAARMTLAGDPGSLQGAVAAESWGAARSSSAPPRRARGCSKPRRSAWRPVPTPRLSPRRCPARSTQPATDCPGSAIRSTGRAIRAPSESSSSRTRTG